MSESIGEEYLVDLLVALVLRLEPEQPVLTEE